MLLSLADPRGGHHQHAPPQRDPILSFSYMFLPKSARIGGWHPSQRLSAPPPTGNPGSVTDHGLFSPLSVVAWCLLGPLVMED